jgi:hypothetical protein
LDAITNARKEDRVIVTGLTSKDPSPRTFEDKRKWKTGIDTSLLNKLNKKQKKNILFINQGKSNRRDLPTNGRSKILIQGMGKESQN